VIIESGSQSGIDLPDSDDFHYETGQGVSVRTEEQSISVGGPRMLGSPQNDLPEALIRASEWLSSKGARWSMLLPVRP